VGIEDLELPGGVRIEKPDPTAEQLGQLLIQLVHGKGGNGFPPGIVPMLQSISNQLDLMIRLEVGQRPKGEVKTMINIYDAKAQEEQERLIAEAAERNGDGTASEANAEPAPDSTVVEGN